VKILDMKTNEKIRYNTVKDKKMSNQELRNVVAGNCPPGCYSNGTGCVSADDGTACGGGNTTFICYRYSSTAGSGYMQGLSFEAGIAYCDIWTDLGASCQCFPE
jgi:natural product precursor